MIKLITRRILGSPAETVCVCTVQHRITNNTANIIPNCAMRGYDTIWTGNCVKNYRYRYNVTVKLVCSMCGKIYERNFRFRQLPPKTMKHSIARPVVPWGAGGAMAPPYFCRSVNLAQQLISFLWRNNLCTYSEKNNKNLFFYFGVIDEITLYSDYEEPVSNLDFTMNYDQAKNLDLYSMELRLVLKTCWKSMTVQAVYL